MAKYPDLKSYLQANYKDLLTDAVQKVVDGNYDGGGFHSINVVVVVVTVIIPDANGILGDKLTAFAPHTTGIPFGANKELEILKQLFDCGSLFDVMSDYDEVCVSYHKIVKAEMEYRGLSLSPNEVLMDTINGSLCIASRGQLIGEEYAYFKDGISRI